MKIEREREERARKTKKTKDNKSLLTCTHNGYYQGSHSAQLLVSYKI